MPAEMFVLRHNVHEMEGVISGIPSEWIDRVGDAWERVTEQVYLRSQENVHVITGRLKSTGKWHVFYAGEMVIEAIVEYGGVAYDGYDVDYALYEEGRGGSHAFLTRAAEQAFPMFEAAFGGT